MLMQALEIAVFLLFGHQIAPAVGSIWQCPAGAKPFPSGITGAGHVGEAKLFTIHYFTNYKVVRYNPILSTFKPQWDIKEQRGKPIPEFVLYQCGTPKPTPSAENNISANAAYYSIPVQKLAVGWSGMMHFIEMLSVTEAVSVIDMRYISSPCMQLLEECTPGLHEANSGSDWQKEAESVNMVLTDSFGTGFSEHGNNVVFDMSLDPGTMDRVSWIFFIASLFNEEKLAARIYNQIESEYLALKDQVAALGSSSTTKPIIVWVQYSDWLQFPNLTWCGTCGGAYRISSAHFKMDLSTDAGGQILTLPAQAAAGCNYMPNTDGSQTYQCGIDGFSHLQQLLSTADMIIDESSSSGTYTMEHFIANFGDASAAWKSVMNGAVFRGDLMGSDAFPHGGRDYTGNAIFEIMPAQPHVILSDMIQALWGSAAPQTQCSMTYLHAIHHNTSKNVLEHWDCPLYAQNGAHDCQGIHDFEHTVPVCAPAQTVSDAMWLRPAALSLSFLWVLAAHAM